MIRLFCPIDGPDWHRQAASISRQLFVSEDDIKAEHCYYVLLEHGIDATAFLAAHGDKLRWLLCKSPFELAAVATTTTLLATDRRVVEIGPRLQFKTPYCSNALSVFASSGLTQVTRVERSTRYSLPISTNTIDDIAFLDLVGDKMTQMIYDYKISFETTPQKEPYFEVDVAFDNLDKANKELGLAFDEEDLKYYKHLFRDLLKKNPTDVELFDLAQSDSEHSRHWFFRGRIAVDGVERTGSLMDVIRDTQKHSNDNSLIAFSDNSSAVRGFDGLRSLRTRDPTTSSVIEPKTQHQHIIYTAETHNFPTAVCPFEGATTGTGGRLRDVQATGRGASEIAGVVGYSFGNINLDDYELPWEDRRMEYPPNFAHPRQVIIEGSNGASSYGNKFGEPVVCGFSRSFAQRVNGERIEYVKPILFSGGIGSIDNEHLAKNPAEVGHFITKIGGPVFRVGVGGGAASSLAVQGTRDATLDFSAVQRGDAEMGQKMHRVVKGCVELADANPIVSIHDQGAGGNGNVLKEIVEGKGADIKANAFQLGDDSISARELWTAEYQESNALLVADAGRDVIAKIGRRERCDVSFVGNVTDGSTVKFRDYDENKKRLPFDIDMSILQKRPKKFFQLKSSIRELQPLALPTHLSVLEALNVVLRRPSVASKRFLTCKVDRSVTGLIAQQQCVGPLHTPLADVAVVALSHFETVGGAVAVGEQPIKGLVSCGSGARMSVAESLTNLVFAPITSIRDVKMSGNWMWAAKMHGEGARLVETCDAMCDALKELGCAIDGGKDSLSMVVQVGDELVKAPGTLVISAYAPCTNITQVITPDLKICQEDTVLIHIRMGSDPRKHRLGGSELAQAYAQIGEDAPDIDDFAQFRKAFTMVQNFIKDGCVLAGHDVSDGGLVTALLEMAFAGNVGISANIPVDGDALNVLFAEESAVILQVTEKMHKTFLGGFGANAQLIGVVTRDVGPKARVRVVYADETVVDERLVTLREMWEETSDRLQTMQTPKEVIEQHKKVRETATTIAYKATFDWSATLHDASYFTTAPRVAIVREEGSNGDREIAAAFTLAGFAAHDVTMTDLNDGLSFDQFSCIAFVGGFSFGDVLGSAKGWAASIRYNEKLSKEFERFRQRSDTLSFGVCNGCQLMALLGWVGEQDGKPSVYLDDNLCGRFESSFGPVRIEKSKCVWLDGMDESVLGLWSSHGQGRFTYDNDSVRSHIETSGLVCVRYCDGDGQPTEVYPWNANGSEGGVAGICSDDGRHFALMPHSDRSFMSWHWPNYPSGWKSADNGLMKVSPWIRMFRNAYEWVVARK